MLSQNGWEAGDRTKVKLTTVTVPGTSTRLPVRAGDVATVLLWAATRWHREVEPLVEPGNWGYAYRAIRGATTLSNHASGTAIDLNAPKHPLGTNPEANFTKDQIKAVRRIVADSGGVLRWGGDYTGRKDGMHLEINAGPAAVAALAARIRATGGGMAEEGFLMALTDEQQMEILYNTRRIRGTDPNVDSLQAIGATLARIAENVADVQRRVRGGDPNVDALQALSMQLADVQAKLAALAS